MKNAKTAKIAKTAKYTRGQWFFASFPSFAPFAFSR